MIADEEFDEANANVVVPVDKELKVEMEKFDDSPSAHPWDPEKIRITTKHFSLREVVDQINDKDIDLSPDFQRDYVWSTQQKIRLIESVLLGIPLPAFYFNQESDGSFQIVDGVQRLSTISSFMNNLYSLQSQHLEYLKHLDGINFENLPSLELRRFRATQIVVHVIEPSTPNGIKYDIFSRVNTLGSPLKPQEIRHAMSTSRAREYLKLLSENDFFDNATGWNFWNSVDGIKVRDSGRMTNQELVLRYCAFKMTSIDEYRNYASLDRFLIDFTRRLDGRKSEESDLAPISDDELNLLYQSFISSMRSAYDILGDNAFRRIEEGKKRGPINRAIFESQSIALSLFSYNKLIDKKEEVKQSLLELFKDEIYLKSVTVSTGSPSAVIARLTKPINELKSILND